MVTNKPTVLTLRYTDGHWTSHFAPHGVRVATIHGHTSLVFQDGDSSRVRYVDGVWVSIKVLDGDQSEPV